MRTESRHFHQSKKTWTSPGKNLLTATFGESTSVLPTHLLISGCIPRRITTRQCETRLPPGNFQNRGFSTSQAQPEALTNSDPTLPQRNSSATLSEWVALRSLLLLFPYIFFFPS